MTTIFPTWRRASRTFPIGKDPHFASVILSLPFNGPNGSTTFTDVSSAGRTVTGFGNAQISTALLEQNRSNVLFDGTGDYLGVTLPAFGASDFSVETDLYLGTLGDYRNVFESRANDADSLGFVFGVNAAGQLYVYHANGFRILSGALRAGYWYKVALTRASNVWRGFIDGRVQSNPYTSSANLSRTAVRIGADWNSLYWMNGRMRNYRVTTVARYTADYTPVTTPFPVA
jgi:hypothetical protein